MGDLPTIENREFTNVLKLCKILNLYFVFCEPNLLIKFIKYDFYVHSNTKQKSMLEINQQVSIEVEISEGGK